MKGSQRRRQPGSGSDIELRGVAKVLVFFLLSVLWTHTQSTHLCYGGLFVVVEFVKGAWTNALPPSLTYKFTNTFKLLTYYFIYTHLFVLYVLAQIYTRG